MSSDVAISTFNLSKAYQIYRKPIHRLLQMLCRGKRRFYDQYWSLRGVSVDIRRGETVGVIGRNGAGKSTFLQLVCGTLTPSIGTVEVHGRVAALLELGAGFNPEFTGRENVFLSASILGLSRNQVLERFDSITEFAGIGDFIDQPVKIYSSGMYARLAFAVAAHVDADILIIDEILAVGDAAFTQKCMRFIRQFKKTGTILFVSHDTSSVVNLCDRCLWLENGKLREFGETKDVCHNYLASLEREKQGASDFRIGGERSRSEGSAASDGTQQEAKAQASNFASEVKVFDFNPNSPWFGKRGATIVKTRLLAADGSVKPNLHGGEPVRLEITAKASAEIDGPILGFYVRDRLGQNLFGENTFVSHQDRPMRLEAGDEIVATFTFTLPFLAAGSYSVCPAIAEGCQDHHLQHHWIDEGLIFNVISSNVAHGIMGVPMLEVSVEINSSKPALQAGLASLG
jgi:lipopolysaccharide transport system ATP-binding protein